jgi:uncharacterized protein YndB with AHSA1/START domain
MFSNEDSVVSEIHIAAAPERVFRAITSDEEVKLWMNQVGPMKLRAWEMDAKVGGSWRYDVVDSSGKGLRGVTEFRHWGEIIEYDPPRTLAYTWITNFHIDPKMKTLVRWELVPKSGGTLVRVTHTGLSPDPEMRKDYGSGWPGLLQEIKNYLER